MFFKFHDSGALLENSKKYDKTFLNSPHGR